MSKPNWVTEIEALSGGKPVLLVEGNIDTRILAYFLAQVSPGWETRIVMLAARTKSRVIECQRNYHSQWAGVVDIDEWPPDKVKTELQNISRIRALPRFCLENYFCVPEELWNALPPAQQEVIGNDPERLAKPILEKLPDWVAHGAMWRVIRGRRTGLLYESGFPAELDRAPVTDVNEIRRILKSWHDQLDPDRIIVEYEQELKKAQRLPVDEQLKRYVHGKKFFRMVITPTLNALFGPLNSDIWLQRFTQSAYGLSVPADLHEFLTEVLDLFA